MNLPDKCLVDTNVPKVANNAVPMEVGTRSDFPDKCVLACQNAIDHVIKSNGLIMDNNGEILREYLGQLSPSGQLQKGDIFMKWVLNVYLNSPDSDRVTITKSGESYEEFPDHKELVDFDPSDRKFVAVANAHKDKPPILQATDSKWWGWKDALEAEGISVVFLCLQYIEEKYEQKMGG